MRIDVFVDGNRVFSEGLDAHGAWEQPGESAAVRDVGDAARHALEHGVAYRFNGISFARRSQSDLGIERREAVGVSPIMW